MVTRSTELLKSSPLHLNFSSFTIDKLFRKFSETKEHDNNRLSHSQAVISQN